MDDGRWTVVPEVADDGRLRKFRLSSIVGRLSSVVRRPSIWSVPVGLQLSVIYAVLLAVTLALLGTVLYVRVDDFLVQNTVDRLTRTTQPIVDQALARAHRGPPPGPGFDMHTKFTTQPLNASYEDRVRDLPAP